VDQTLDHLSRALGGGGVVQVDERNVVDPAVQNRKIGADRLDVQRSLPDVGQFHGAFPPVRPARAWRPPARSGSDFAEKAVSPSRANTWRSARRAKTIDNISGGWESDEARTARASARRKTSAPRQPASPRSLPSAWKRPPG